MIINIVPMCLPQTRIGNGHIQKGIQNGCCEPNLHGIAELSVSRRMPPGNLYQFGLQYGDFYSAIIYDDYEDFAKMVAHHILFL